MRCCCWTVAVFALAVISANCDFNTPSANNDGDAANRLMTVSTAFASVPSPADVAVDAAGDLLVVSMYNHSVYRCRRDGTMLQLAGNGSAGFANGNASVSMLNSPRGIACDNVANIAYITDFENNCVRELQLSGDSNLTTLAGNGAPGLFDAVGSDAMFHWPVGVALRVSAGLLYVADSASNKIRRVDVSSGSVITLGYDFSACYYVCIAGSGALWVSSNNTTVTRDFVDVGPHNTFTIENSANGITLSNDGSTIAVVSNSAQNVRTFAVANNGIYSNASFTAGNSSQGFTDGPLDKATFNNPIGATWYCNATSLLCGVLVCDSGNNAIRFVSLSTLTVSRENVLTLSTTPATTASASARWTASRPLPRQRTLSQRINATRHSMSSSLPSESSSRKISTLASTLTPFNPTTTINSIKRVPQSLSKMIFSAAHVSQTSPEFSISLSRSSTLALSAVDASQPQLSMQPVTWGDKKLACQAFVAHIRMRIAAEGNSSPSSGITSTAAALNKSTLSSCLPLAQTGSGVAVWTAAVPAQGAEPQGSVFLVAFRMPSLQQRVTQLDYCETQEVNFTLCVAAQNIAYNITTANSATASQQASNSAADNGTIVYAVIAAIFPLGFVAGKSALVTAGIISSPSDDLPQHMTNVTIRFDFPAAAPTRPSEVVISRTTQVTTAIAATGAAAFGNDVATTASLVLLSLLSCTTLAPNPGPSKYAMSVFYDEGSVAMVLGNLGLMALIAGLHFCVMTVTTRWCCVSRSRRSSVSRNALAIDEDVWGGFRFPALIIRIAEFLLPGTFFAASLSLWSSSTGTVVAGVVGFVTVLCATGFAAAWYHHRLRDQLTFVGGTLFTVDTTLGQHFLQTLWSSIESTILWQAGQWQPAAMRNSYGPLMNPFVPGREWARSLVMCLSLLLAFVSAMASSNVGCNNGALVVGVAHLTGGLVLAVVRTYRMRIDGLLGDCPHRLGVCFKVD